MKPRPNYSIENSQTGLISGRNIADSIHLVYDIHTTEKLDIQGTLVSY